MTVNDTKTPEGNADLGIMRQWTGDAVPGRSPGAALVQELVELAGRDARIMVLTADLAAENQLNLFAEAHPERFRNLGAAARNALGVAAGMAAAGKIPFVIVSGLAAIQAADLVATSIAGSGLHVIVAALPSGAESRAGGDHLAFADLALMLAVPGLRVVVPADAGQTVAAARALLAAPGPAYLRVLRGEQAAVSDDSTPFNLGTALPLRDGQGMTIVATGALVVEALRAAELLEGEGLSPSVICIHTLKPLDAPAIRRAAHDTGGLIIAEEHALAGGLGAAIAQDLARTHPVPIEFVAVEDRDVPGAEPTALRPALGLSAQAIVEAALRLKERLR